MACLVNVVKVVFLVMYLLMPETIRLALVAGGVPTEPVGVCREDHKWPDACH